MCVSSAVAPGRRVAVAGFLCAVFVIGSASPSAASCAPPLPLTEALASSDLVVVGTVTAARSADRIATVAVEDIWMGDAETVIEVAGGPEQPNAATSVDRTYEVGTRYLFFILEPAQHGNPPGNFPMQYVDNNCSNTRPYTSDLDSLRPASAHRIALAPTTTSTTSTPSAGTSASENRSPVVVIAGAALFFGGLLTAALIVRHRRGLRAVA